MPEFQYEGVDRGGKKVGGTLAAETEGALRMALRGQGIRPIKISKVSAMNIDLGAFFSGAGTRLSAEALILLTRQLQVLLNSSVPLVQALDILCEQAPDAGSRAIIGAIKEKVSSGSYLWEALALHPKAFPRLYISLVRAGEASGSTDQMLKRLSRYLEDSNRMKKIIKSASMYPAVISFIAVGVIMLLMTVVIPRFESMLIGAGQTLPMPTQVVINISRFFQRNYLLILALIGGSIYLGRRYYQTPEGRSTFDRIVYEIPYIGGLMQKAGIARFARTMQTLLSSGVNLVDAIEVCRGTIDNAVLETAIDKIKAEIESGKTLAMVTSRLSVFPKMASQMIAVGESTGNLDKMLDKIADFYEEDVETAIAGLTKIIEPIMLVVIGGLVGGILIAMYLPVFKMGGAS